MNRVLYVIVTIIIEITILVKLLLSRMSLVFVVAERDYLSFLGYNTAKFKVLTVTFK